MKIISSIRYQVIIPRDVEKTIALLPKKDIINIFEKLEQLATASTSLDVKKWQDMLTCIGYGIATTALSMKFKIKSL